MRILFLGNSHTQRWSIPELVKNILSTGRKEKLTVDFYFGPSLNELSRVQNVISAIQSRRYTHVVLQGAMLSSSQKYKYSPGWFHSSCQSRARSRQ